jgi:hypothetical protein
MTNNYPIDYKISPIVSEIIDQIIPDHIRGNYPNFVKFIQVFFSYLEAENKSGYYQNTIPEQKNIFLQDPQFLSIILSEVGFTISQKYTADPKIFYSRIIDLWKSKGSRESIKLFFRIFFNETVSVSYPWDSVLIPSDGRWIREKIIRVTMLSNQHNPKDYVGKKIFQRETQASAFIERVESKIYSDGVIWELYLTSESISNDFEEKKNIIFDDNEGIKAEVYRSLSELVILDGGSGYKIGDRISVRGFEGFTFVAYVSSVNLNGKIIDIKITDFGSGNTPFHIKSNNQEEKYYFRDFILYDYNFDSSILDDLNSIPNNIDISENPGLEETSILFKQDYFKNDILYFGEDYIGTSSIDKDTIDESLTSDIIRKSIILISSENGNNAILDLKFNSIVSYPGRYDGVNGQLSESIVLQDSFYYQKYSYEINTTTQMNKWENDLKRHIHPSGINLFGNFKMLTQIPTSMKSSDVLVSEIDILDITPRIDSSEQLCVKETITGVNQNYIEYSYFAEDYFGISVFNELENQMCQNQSQDNIIETQQ